jgi:hypothetical protein
LRAEKGFSYEGTRGSVMLNVGPVNKNCHKEAQKPQMSSLSLFVALFEPRDDGEAFAARDGNDFVKRVGGEGD